MYIQDADESMISLLLDQPNPYESLTRIPLTTLAQCNDHLFQRGMHHHDPEVSRLFINVHDDIEQQRLAEKRRSTTQPRRTSCV